MPRKSVANWGNYPRVDAEWVETNDLLELRSLVGSGVPLIARGNGRCYGDASLGETIFSTLRLNKFLEFDKQAGVIECEAGVLLSEILDVALPAGFFLPVTPGTKFITVGGAIAADVHGKNHHVEGSFARYVDRLDIMVEDGSILSCSPTENTDLFWRTCGGMGLTGVILSARIRLKPVETAYIRHAAVKTTDINSTFEAFDARADATYSVAWIDCTARGSRLGRSILQLGEHALAAELPARYQKAPVAAAAASGLRLPMHLPSYALNPLTLKVFNAAYYHRPITQSAIVHFDPFFYPLDAVLDWNKAYGKAGFLQYQFVLPLEASQTGIVKILDMIRESGEGSPLAVLKLFGDPEPEAVMSFPMKGYTMALDFKVSSKVLKLLDELDVIVADLGGRCYLAKDARMSADAFHRTYKHTVRSGSFCSKQAVRLEN